MNSSRWITGGLGLFFLLAATWNLRAAQQGLQVIRVTDSQPPMTFILPEGADPATRPLVLIGHGLAGSGQVMRGFALTLAHAGYVTALWDFNGHGANPQPLSSTSGSGSLLANAEAVLAEAERRGLGAPGQAAILGHSMGSGVALSFGQVHPETSATIAISPVDVSVTPALPRNLLLMAGSLEGNFVRNAKVLLAEAGGEGGNPAAGTGRKLVVIPGVEHVSILFKPQAHQVARLWLDAVFGPQPGAQDYVDLRVFWFGLGALGTVLVSAAWIPSAIPEPSAARSLGRRLFAIAAGALGATLILGLVGMAGLQLPQLFGVLVGGYLLLWFAIAGVIALLILHSPWSKPSGKAVWTSLLVFAALWLGFGLLGDKVWLPWLLIHRRLLLWPLGALLLLPWFLTLGEASSTANPLGRVGWWAFQSLVLVGSMLLALQLSQGLYFILLILPLFPLILGLHTLAMILQRDRWTLGISGALFVSWMLLAVFPLQ
jgi:pimeloyl-ACP methyl ester carboxylesterase